MAGRYVEAGDGYDWVEDPPTAVEKLTSGADWASKDAAAKIKAFNIAGITPAELQSVGVSPADISWMQSQGYTGAAPSVTTNIAGANVAAPSSIRTDLATNPEYLNALASSGETGRTAQEIQSTLAPIVRDLGNGMQGSYSPVTGELQNIYSSSNTGGRYDTQGNFIPFDKPTSFFGGLYEAIADMPGNIYQGLSDVVESDTFQTMAPAVIGGVIGSGAFGGELFGAAAATDASFLAADAAQLAAQGLSEAAIAQNLGAYGSQAAASLAASMAANGLDVTTMTQQLNNLSSNTGLISQTGSAADFAAADALKLQSQVGNNFAAIEQNLIASGVDPLIAADISNQIAMNPGLTQSQLATNLSNSFGSNIYDVNAATTYPTSTLPGNGGLLSDVTQTTQAATTPTTTPTTTSPATTSTTPTSTTPTTQTPSSLLDTALKTAKIASLGATALGLLSGAGQTSGGETGFPIVPIPSDWKSPVSNQAAFTPSAPINFGSSALLKGTQWENQLPQRGFSMTDVMNQLKSNQPAGMNDIIGGLNGRQVSISDIISGIQGQYGQKAAS